jgi:hypothetical protein
MHEAGAVQRADVDQADARVLGRIEVTQRLTTLIGKAEQRAGGRSDLDVVLLSADSLETVKRTHSSYFDGSKSLDELLPA